MIFMQAQSIADTSIILFILMIVKASDIMWLLENNAVSMSSLETGQLNILLTSDIFFYKNTYSLACLKN